MDLTAEGERELGAGEIALVEIVQARQEFAQEKACDGTAAAREPSCIFWKRGADGKIIPGWETNRTAMRVILPNNADFDARCAEILRQFPQEDLDECTAKNGNLGAAGPAHKANQGRLLPYIPTSPSTLRSTVDLRSFNPNHQR